MNQKLRTAYFLIVMSIGYVFSSQTCAQDESSKMSDWVGETIMLPPRFAPELPNGVEELRFPLGWRNPDSDNFWSYAIVMRLDEGEPSIERLAELTELYYTGLMGAFGVGRDPDGLPNTVEVQLIHDELGSFIGTMHLVDGFATKKHIEVNLKIGLRAQSRYISVLEYRVSPQPDDHAIWSQLQDAIEQVHEIQPIQMFAHLPHGEWRTGTLDGRQQRDVWTWGPSRRSLTSVTTNNKNTSESIFGSFRMIYDNPQRDDLSVIALDAPELIQTGTVKVNEKGDYRFDMELLYDVEKIEWAWISKRAISSAWIFENPSNYMNSWIEDMGKPVPPGTTDWRYFNHPGRTPWPPSATDPPEEVLYLEAFLPLFVSQWETEYLRTSFEWIPYNEAILMRTIDIHEGLAVEESVFFPDPLTKEIHAVGISATGSVDEGIVQTDGGEILIRSTRSTHDGTTEIEQQFMLLDSGELEIRTWLIDGSERALQSTTTHKPSSN